MAATFPAFALASKTAEYIDHVLTRLTLAARYLCCGRLCFADDDSGEVFSVSFYFGGTSLLIIVSVALDTVQQIESHLITRNYESFSEVRGPRIRGRRGVTVES
jgi:preprotein translocase subunit SecY